MTGVWYRSGSQWVGSSGVGSGEPPPPAGAAKFAGHVPNRVLFGFAASEVTNTKLTYADAVALTGTIYERRKFKASWVTESWLNTTLDEILGDNQYPWLSFKVTGNDWAGVAAGGYDSGLDTIIKVAGQRTGDDFCVSVHHEPSGDGSLSDWAAMQTYISNYLADVPNLAFAPIGNGWWFSSVQWDPASFNAAFPQSLLGTLNANQHFLAVDTYDSASAADRAATKMGNFIDWCRERNVAACGFGEWGCETGDHVAVCWNLLADNCDIVGVANYFNSGENTTRNYLLVPNPYTGSNGESVGTAESQVRLDNWKLARTASASANPGHI